MVTLRALRSKEAVSRRLEESKFFRRHGDHYHLARGFSRRDFLKSAGVYSAALMGAAIYPNIKLPGKPGPGGTPNPIVGGFELAGSFFHIELPDHPAFGTGTPETEDPSTVGDFKGMVAMGYSQGMGERLDKSTGQVEQLPYEVDLRIMKGVYIDVDGKRSLGNFALI